MRLLIATDCFLPRWDGIARFLSLLLPELRKDFTVTVIAPDFPGSTVSLRGVKIIRIKTYNFQVGDYTPSKIKVNTIKEEVEKNDIIFTQTIGPIGAVSAILGRSLGKKVVAYVHSLEWELFANSISENSRVRDSIHRISRPFVRKIYSNCDRLIVPSKKTGQLMEEAGITVPRTVVKIGIDTKIFAPPKDRDHAKKKIGIPVSLTVGYAGRIGREKDLPTFIRAAKEVRKEVQDCQFLVVGSGITTYDEMMQKEGIIRFGSTDRMAGYLQAMDIYCLCSKTETSSLSTMEAMACGAVPVVTGVGETRVYVKEGKNGYRFKIGDHMALAKIIIRLLKEKGRRRILARKARQIIIDNYPWNKTVKGIADVLRIKPTTAVPEDDPAQKDRAKNIRMISFTKV